LHIMNQVDAARSDTSIPVPSPEAVRAAAGRLADGLEVADGRGLFKDRELARSNPVGETALPLKQGRGAPENNAAVESADAASLTGETLRARGSRLEKALVDAGDDPAKLAAAAEVLQAHYAEVGAVGFIEGNNARVKEAQEGLANIEKQIVKNQEA